MVIYAGKPRTIVSHASSIGGVLPNFARTINLYDDAKLHGGLKSGNVQGKPKKICRLTEDRT